MVGWTETNLVDSGVNISAPMNNKELDVYMGKVV